MLLGSPKNHSFIFSSICSLCKPCTVESQLVDLFFFTSSTFASSNYWYVPCFWILSSYFWALGVRGCSNPGKIKPAPRNLSWPLPALCKLMALSSCSSLHVPSCMPERLNKHRIATTIRPPLGFSGTERREAPSPPPGSHKLQRVPSEKRPSLEAFSPLSLHMTVHWRSNFQWVWLPVPS